MVKGTLIFCFRLCYPGDPPQEDTHCRYTVVPWHRDDAGNERSSEVVYELRTTNPSGAPRWRKTDEPAGRDPLLRELFRIITDGIADHEFPVTETAHGVRSIDLGRIPVPRSVGRVRNFIAEVQVSCTDCGEPFHFLCPDTGLSFTRPTVNVGATMLHAPIAPGRAALPEHIRFEVPRPAGSES
jgi:hypothetical protein